VILERAIFQVTPGTEQDFEAAMEQAKEVISQSGGFRSFRLQRGIEEPSSYLLLVEWDSVQDHMQGFRESALFVRWRELIGPFFAAAPEVQHYQAAVVTK
jgi:heme-degrading monooxygenase HmoA